jgi:hypothetical protein
MTEARCMDCRHLVWLVAIGQGIRCANPANRGCTLYPGVKSSALNFEAPPVPSRSFVCGHFERRARPAEGSAMARTSGHGNSDWTRTRRF